MDRPKLQQLISGAQNLVSSFYSVDRVSEVSRFSNLIEILDENDVGINFANEEIDTTTLMGKAMRNILIVFAEFESDMVSKEL